MKVSRLGSIAAVSVIMLLLGVRAVLLGKRGSKTKPNSPLGITGSWAGTVTIGSGTPTLFGIGDLMAYHGPSQTQAPINVEVTYGLNGTGTFIGQANDTHVSGDMIYSLGGDLLTQQPPTFLLTVKSSFPRRPSHLRFMCIVCMEIGYRSNNKDTLYNAIFNACKLHNVSAREMRVHSTAAFL